MSIRAAHHPRHGGPEGVVRVRRPAGARGRGFCRGMPREWPDRAGQGAGIGRAPEPSRAAAGFRRPRPYGLEVAR